MAAINNQSRAEASFNYPNITSPNQLVQSITHYTFVFQIHSSSCAHKPQPQLQPL